MGIAVGDLERYLLDGHETKLTTRTVVHPASVTWPMGFSWSSAVAQDVTLNILQSTGLPEDAIICGTEELPADDSELAVVATDDTLLFHKDLAAARRRLEAFDDAMETANVPRSADKDINFADSLTGLGCELSASPPQAAPERSKLLNVFLASLGLDMAGQASPKALHSILGI